MANFPDPDAWANGSDALQAAIGRAIGTYAGRAVLAGDTGTKTSDGQPQTLAALLATQVGLSQQILARLAAVESKLGGE